VSLETQEIRIYVARQLFAVCHHNQSGVLKVRRDALKDIALRRCIQPRCRFIKDHQARLAQK